MKIDIHCHYTPRNCLDLIDPAGQKFGPSIVKDETGQEILVADGSRLGHIGRQAYDAKTQLKDMDRIGIDIRAISPAPFSFFYHIDPELCLSTSKIHNDSIAQVVNAYPDRFFGIATVPMQDINKAILELERTVNELGFKGVEISSNINGKNLDEPEFLPFYETAQALGIPIIVHPYYVVGTERLKRHYLSNLVGNPVDTTIAIASIIFGGIVERFPKLKWVFVHAGGAAPYIKGRWDHAYYHGVVVEFDIPKPPTEYFKTLYLDTVAHSQPALTYLINTHGADHVVLGSDYPFDMSDPNPVNTVKKQGLSARDEAKILGQNAAALLGL
ncbi:amidohydrolase family protein [Chloroflexota bacterium]